MKIKNKYTQKDLASLKREIKESSKYYHFMKNETSATDYEFEMYLNLEAMNFNAILDDFKEKHKLSDEEMDEVTKLF